MNIRLVLSTTALALGLTATQAFAQIAYGTTFVKLSLCASATYPFFLVSLLRT